MPQAALAPRWAHPGHTIGGAQAQRQHPGCLKCGRKKCLEKEDVGGEVEGEVGGDGGGRGGID